MVHLFVQDANLIRIPSPVIFIKQELMGVVPQILGQLQAVCVAPLPGTTVAIVHGFTTCGILVAILALVALTWTKKRLEMIAMVRMFSFLYFSNFESTYPAAPYPTYPAEC